MMVSSAAGLFFPVLAKTHTLILVHVGTMWHLQGISQSAMGVSICLTSIQVETTAI